MRNYEKLNECNKHEKKKRQIKINKKILVKFDQSQKFKCPKIEKIKSEM